jgi:hypothetical protein
VTERTKSVADARTLPRAEWERLLRERVYLRPIPVAPALHQMARRRNDEHLAEDITNPEETNR